VVAEPAIIVEVMFPASEADDTGRKWLCYQKIPSLKHYLVLAQDRCLVQVHSRAGDLWRERFERRHDRARPHLRLDVAALYAQTDLAA
jgi:Uma2 family endonuclease